MIISDAYEKIMEEIYASISEENWHVEDAGDDRIAVWGQEEDYSQVEVADVWGQKYALAIGSLPDLITERANLKAENQRHKNLLNTALHALQSEDPEIRALAIEELRAVLETS